MTHRKAASNVCAMLLAAFVLFQPAPGKAAQDVTADTDAGETREALLNPSDADLLLFWEEKDLYVQTATRTDKPLTQVAENMTVVTAKDIEDMNAHSLAEVLSRVPGMFVDFAGQDFNGASLLHIQGSSERLVTVLLDGVVWNFLSGGNAEVSGIPVRIIDRIEIIKGPASSAWGSALGGVVNIITKGTGNSAVPKGTVSASYGEANSQDYNAELYGKQGDLGYYLYAGRQQTDGLRNSRDADQNRFYAKLKLTPTRDLSLLFTTGYSNPFVNDGNVQGGGVGVNPRFKDTSYFATGSVDYRISPEWSLKVESRLLQQKLDTPNTFTTPFLTAQPGDFFKGNTYDEQTVGGNLKLVYSSIFRLGICIVL